MTASRRILIVVGLLIAVAVGLPWGGGVPEAQAQTIQVTAADPPTGEQGTINLNVLIKGKGFKNGAKAKFYKTGTTDPAGVNVKSTLYVSSTQLVANIDIADEAALALFDIEVRNADGRTGKGTELFSVTAKKVSACTAPDPVPTGGLCTSGQPGCLDTTFGQGTGKVIGPRYLDTGDISGRSAVAIQQIAGEARIVVVGRKNDVCTASSRPIWYIARYLSDGSLDPSFGSNGLVTITFAGSAAAHGVAIQRVVGTDGVARNKIIAVGYAQPSKSSNKQPTAVRLNEDGSLDSTFGTSGMTFVPLAGKNSNGGLYAAAIQSDGKIVAAGFGPYWNTGLVLRLTSNGALDKTFNGTGLYAHTSSESRFQTVTTQLVGSEERILAAGYTRYGGGAFIATVWRFTSLGAPDSGFGTSGIVMTSFHGDHTESYYEDEFTNLSIDSSHGLVAVGFALTALPNTMPTSKMVLARYDEFGNLDTDFGVGGAAAVPSRQSYELGYALAIQADGLIVVGGQSHDYDANGPVNNVARVWRFTATGAVDSTFGDNGSLLDAFTGAVRGVSCHGLVLQTDWTVLWAGEAVMNGDPRITYAVLARFWQ